MRRLISERVILFVILLNALVLFLEAFPTLRLSAGPALLAIDSLCVVYFILEAVLKMRFQGIKGYFGDPWNLFDLGIVVVSLPSLFTGAPALFTLLRLLRLLRFLRLMRFIPNIERLMIGGKRALKASVGIFMLVFCYLFIFGLSAHYMFGYQTTVDASGAVVRLYPEFSDPLLSMYTMFKIFTIEGWYEMSDNIAAHSTGIKAHLIRLYFIFAVSFGGIVILSLLNAVFVDEMSHDIAARTEDEVEEISEEVEEIDVKLERLSHKLICKLDEINERLDRLEGKQE
ncbi:MAG: ion transporter [Planctomycetales bacterium]|nr:ion transporter [bacterium]UNM08675.1 MAG: ion transporter [Planctomycetales bacterium]